VRKRGRRRLEACLPAGRLEACRQAGRREVATKKPALPGFGRKGWQGRKSGSGRLFRYKHTRISPMIFELVILMRQ